MSIVSDMLWQSERIRPLRSALVDRDRTWTYAHLAERTRRAVNGLRGLGVEPGTRVAVLATNCGEYAEVVFALSEIGAVWVPLNYRLNANELGHILGDADCRVLLHTSDLSSVVDELTETLDLDLVITIGDEGSRWAAYEDVLRSGSATLQRRPVGPDSVFTIMYTSGTTGLPKGVVLTHRSFVFGTVATALTARGVSERDVKLQLIPQFHAGGQVYQLAHLLVGGTIVVSSWRDPTHTLETVRARNVSVIGVVPAMLMAILDEIQTRPTAIPSLRRVMYGGSGIPQDRLLGVLEALPIDFQQTYGQTEAGVLVTMLSADVHRLAATQPQLALSCGKEMVGYRVAVIDDAGRPLPTGHGGEVAIAGDSLMERYWNRPEATAETLRDGWLRTGDVGRLDDEGYLYITDRMKDIIVTGAENVSPAEIEQIVSRHPAVLEVAVIGVPDDRWGEAVTAVVATRPGSTADSDEIIAFCREELSGFKVPKSVVFIEHLPRNASGKVQKHILREPYWQDRARRI